MANALNNFEFFHGKMIWYDILFVVNMISKILQSTPICIDSSMQEERGIMLSFEKYKEEDFATSFRDCLNYKALHLKWV